MDIDTTTGLGKDTFGLARVSDGTRSYPALVRPNGEVLDLTASYARANDIYEDWPRAFDRLVDLNEREAAGGVGINDLHLLPPTERPQVFGAGSNYRKHAAEMYTYNEGEYQKARQEGESDDAFFARNMEFVEQKRATGMPFIWMATHGCLVGARDDVRLPLVGDQHD
ncbi:hypothetical protein [Salipiger sp. IMCC34102]|uniref:hypothetical protein n=1 Tax=Salipiger sp. IMCC34102 TaxID=2510647 RepID=UPI001A9274A3|nr:hypothetical protein [Salipiger sp. IMCC34102]